MTNSSFRQQIDDALVTISGAKWGICRLDFSDYQGEYNYGLVVIFPHDEIMTKEKYNESHLHDLMQAGREKRKVVNQMIVDACAKMGIPCLVTPIPPDHQSPPYKVPFSAKHCATQAGLGWIGKSDLLVTEEYGPRLTTAGFAIAIPEDVEIEVGVPETRSHCGDCVICVECCPWKNIRGVNWDEHTSRDELVDYHNCSEMRFQAVPKLGRKLECAKCIVWCPYGTDAAPSKDG